MSETAIISKTNPYKIQRYVRVEHMGRGSWKLTCQNHIWEAMSERKAMNLKKHLMNYDGNAAQDWSGCFWITDPAPSEYVRERRAALSL